MRRARVRLFFRRDVPRRFPIFCACAWAAADPLAVPRTYACHYIPLAPLKQVVLPARQRAAAAPGLGAGCLLASRVQLGALLSALHAPWHAARAGRKSDAQYQFPAPRAA